MSTFEPNTVTGPRIGVKNQDRTEKRPSETGAHSGILTGDSLGMATALAARDEDDVVLAGIRVVVFEKEELVDAVVVERRDLDDDADGAGQALLDDEVLLPADLGLVTSKSRGVALAVAYLRPREDRGGPCGPCL